MTKNKRVQRRGARGPEGPPGPRGPAGPVGPKGDPGNDSPHAVVTEVRGELDAILKSLQVQFERIAQLQQQLDHLTTVLEPTAKAKG